MSKLRNRDRTGIRYREQNNNKKGWSASCEDCKLTFRSNYRLKRHQKTKRHLKIHSNVNLEDARYSSKTIIIQDPIIIEVESDSENSEDERIRKEKEKENEKMQAEVREHKKQKRIRNKRLRLASAAKIAKRFQRYECSDCVGLEFDSSHKLFVHLRSAHNFNKRRHEQRYLQYNSDFSEIVSSDDTTDQSSSDECAPSNPSRGSRLSTSGEMEIDEHIFEIDTKSPVKSIQSKTTKNVDSPTNDPHPPKRQERDTKNKKTSKKFKIKAMETKLPRKEIRCTQCPITYKLRSHSPSKRYVCDKCYSAGVDKTDNITRSKLRIPSFRLIDSK